MSDVPHDGATPATPESAGVDLRARVQEVIDDMINPAVAMHGGYIELVDVKENKVYVNMSGGCQGCGAAQMTLKAGIEAMLMEEIPEIDEVVDTTDHSVGESPYIMP